MSVKVRAYKRGGWEIDIRLELPNGSEIRERKKSPVSGKAASKRWGETRERKLFEEHSKPKVDLPSEQKEVPTVAAFAPRFLEEHARANRQKPSTVVTKQSILQTHLIPLLGPKKLDEITNGDVQRIKQHLHRKARKTVNNVLTVLNTMMKVAVEWNVITKVPVTIRLLPVAPHEADFHDFEDFERLVGAAENVGPNAHLAVLLGGEAGLRCGEIMALEWADVEFVNRQLLVSKSEWRGMVTVPKGGRSRRIPMTRRLMDALRIHRHLRGPRVVCELDGKPLTERRVQGFVRRAARKASLTNISVHVLRHTFCSHLAMKGVPARSIQELAGHKDLMTTQRYMHLSPAAVEEAIRILDQPRSVSRFGDILETASGVDGNSEN